MEASVYVLSDVNQTFYEPMIYNNDCLLVGDIVTVSEHVLSGHPDKSWGRIPRHLLKMSLSVIGCWFKE